MNRRQANFLTPIFFFFGGCVYTSRILWFDEFIDLRIGTEKLGVPINKILKDMKIYTTILSKDFFCLESFLTIMLLFSFDK